MYAHGLSFFVETSKHKMLVDLGPSEETLENAARLGIDLGEVDAEYHGRSVKLRSLRRRSQAIIHS